VIGRPGKVTAPGGITGKVVTGGIAPPGLGRDGPMGRDPPEPEGSGCATGPTGRYPAPENPPFFPEGNPPRPQAQSEVPIHRATSSTTGTMRFMMGSHRQRSSESLHGN